MYARTLGQDVVDGGPGPIAPSFSNFSDLTSQSVALNLSPLTLLAVGAVGLFVLYSVTKKTTGAVRKVRSGMRKRSARAARKRALQAELANL